MRLDIITASLEEVVKYIGCSAPFMDSLPGEAAGLSFRYTDIETRPKTLLQPYYIGLGACALFLMPQWTPVV